MEMLCFFSFVSSEDCHCHSFCLFIFKSLHMQDAYQYCRVNFAVSDYSPAGGGGGEVFFLSPLALVRYQTDRGLKR